MCAEPAVCAELNPKPVTSIEELIRILEAGKGPREFFIQLNYGLRSYKLISYNPNKAVFSVENLIDGSSQRLNVEEMNDDEHTNIGRAIRSGAFFIEGETR